MIDVALVGVASLVIIWRLLYKTWKKIHSPSLRNEMDQIGNQIVLLKRSKEGKE